MATISEKKIYSQDATGYAQLVADLTAAYEWAKVEAVDELTTLFYDNDGNYIKVLNTNASSIRIFAYAANGAGYTDSYLTAFYVWYVKTAKTFCIFGCGVPTYVIQNESVKSMIFTKTDDGDVIIFRYRYNDEYDNAMMCDKTCEAESKSDVYRAKTYNCYIAVAVPITCRSSRIVCYNAMFLQNNPFSDVNRGAITLAEKNYYMIGNILLLDE